jgi:hypothetical protein
VARAPFNLNAHCGTFSLSDVKDACLMGRYPVHPLKVNMFSMLTYLL